jgi:hypothetical protein
MATNIATPFHFDNHESRLVELYAIVNGDGTIAQGGTGLTITKPSTGTYNVTLQDKTSITSADLANTAMTAAAYNTGVTKTCQILTGAINTFSGTPGAFKNTYVQELASSSGTISFVVKTLSAAALSDQPFSLKVLVSSGNFLSA